MRGPFHSAFGGGVGVRRGGDEPVRPIASGLKLGPDHVDTIDQSHERCVALGVSRIERPDHTPLGRSDLAVVRDRNLRLHDHAAPVMEMLYEQIVNSQSMVVLTDAAGVIRRVNDAYCRIVGLPREELGSIFGIGMQMLNILTEQNVRASIASLKASDVLIVPDLAKVTSVDFKLGRDAIARGAEATRGVLPLLSNYALAPTDYVKQLAVQRRVAVPSRIDEVRIEGTEYTTADVIRAQLSVLPGAPFSRGQIEQDLAWLQGRGDFERLDYRLVTERDRNVLLVNVQEKPWGPNYFRFGLNLGTDFRGEGAFNLIGNHTRRWLNSYGGEWRNELQIGRTQRLSTELYQPLLANETLFVSAGAERERRIADVGLQLADGTTSRPLLQYAGVDTRVWLDLGAAFGRYGELRIGPHYERVSISPKISPLQLTGIKSIDSGFHINAVIDQRDAAAFARAGAASGRSGRGPPPAARSGPRARRRCRPDRPRRPRQRLRHRLAVPHRPPHRRDRRHRADLHRRGDAADDRARPGPGPARPGVARRTRRRQRTAGPPGSAAPPGRRGDGAGRRVEQRRAQARPREPGRRRRRGHLALLHAAECTAHAGGYPAFVAICGSGIWASD